jgi:cytoskeletal protein CcmA (bactofilin family)
MAVGLFQTVSNVATLSAQKAIEGLLVDSSSCTSEYQSRESNMFRTSKRNAADKEPSMTDEELETRILQLPQVDGSAVAHSAPPPAPEGISSISSSLSIVGKIVGNGRLAIFGHVEGEVHASTVQIGDGAQVEGNIVAEELTIGGRVKGAIHANRVKLNSTAVVEGDIYHRSLAIEENAQFEGLSRRQENVIDTPSLVPAKLPQAQAVSINVPEGQRRYRRPQSVAGS